MAIPQLDPDSAGRDLQTLLRGQGADWDADRGKLMIELTMQQVERYISPVPAAARNVVLTAAARGYDNPLGKQSRTTGPFSDVYRAPDRAGVYLTADELAELQALAADDEGATPSGAFTIHPGLNRSGRALDVERRW